MNGTTTNTTDAGASDIATLAARVAKLESVTLVTAATTLADLPQDHVVRLSVAVVEARAARLLGLGLLGSIGLPFQAGYRLFKQAKAKARAKAEAKREAEHTAEPVPAQA